MATTIVTKNSVTAASAPTISDIIQGELASNLTDGFLFSRDEANNIVSFGVIKQGASSTYTPRFDGTNWVSSGALTNDGTNINITALQLGGVAVTSTAAELNILDGVTSTAAELNYVDGVTSNVQTQLDAKSPIASPTFTGTVVIPALTFNGVAITATGAELNYTDGVTSNIQTQLNTKAPLASPSFTGTVTSAGRVDALAVRETIYALSGTTPALSAANGAIQTWTLTANSTPTDSLSNGDSILLKILDGTAYTITWPTMEWIGGTAPTLDTAEDNWIELWKVGGVLFGASVGVSS